MKTKITIKHNGFHGYTSKSIVLDGAPGECVELSGSQIKKLARAACGARDCTCGESILAALAAKEGECYDPIHSPRAFITIPDEGNEIRLRGNYPQN